jgi:hypothetical protein
VRLEDSDLDDDPQACSSGFTSDARYYSVLYVRVDDHPSATGILGIFDSLEAAKAALAKVTLKEVRSASHIVIGEISFGPRSNALRQWWYLAERFQTYSGDGKWTDQLTIHPIDKSPLPHAI